MTLPPPAGPVAPEVVRSAGTSMRPLIRPQALIVVRPADPAALVPGQIVVFRREDRFLAHRVIAVRQAPDGARQLLEKGDNQACASWIAAQDAIGVAVSMRDPVDERRLEVDGRERRIRALVAWGRIEAWLCDLYLRVRRGLPWAGGALRCAALAAVLSLLPLRAVGMRLLLTAHRRRRREFPGDAWHLLLRVFRAVSGGAPRAGAEPLAVRDWPAALEILGAQGLLSLANGVIDAAVGEVPAAARLELRQSAYRAAVLHAVALRTMGEIDHALREAGVPYALLKGTYLDERLYDAVGPREYADIDLLVEKRNVTRAVAALRTCRYAGSGRPWLEAVLRQIHFHLPLHAVGKGQPAVELHWSLVDRANLYRLDDAGVLARRREARIGIGAAQVLGPEDEFIYLCLHAAKHGVLNRLALRSGFPPEWLIRLESGNRLLWFADIERWLRIEGPGMDWETLAGRIREWNAGEDLAVILAAVEALAPGSAAGQALERLGLQALAPARGGIGGWLVRSRLGQRILVRLMRMDVCLLIRPVRFVQLARLFFPAPRQLLGFYGRGRAWLPALYLWHPLRMAARLAGLSCRLGPPSQRGS